MGDPVFLDTAALIALSNTRDALYADARRVNAQLAGTKTALVTSDWVLAEFLGSTAAAAHRNAGIAMIHRLRGSARATVVPADRVEWDRAFGLYSTRLDKEWSLVDCSSMLICGQLGISRVFTSDRHSQQAGLEILLA